MVDEKPPPLDEDPRDFVSADGELEVRHSPDPDKPFYYVAGRFLATQKGEERVRGVLGDFDTQETEIPGVSLLIFELDSHDGEDNVIRAMQALVAGNRDVAPEYVFHPFSHKNVYGAYPPEPAPGADLDPLNPPCAVKVGLVDVGFVDLGSRTEMMTLPDDYEGYGAVASDSEADFGHGESVAWLISRSAPGALIDGESVSRIDGADPAMHGAVTDSELARAVLALVERGCHIITCTLGCTEDPAFPIIATKAAFETAVQDGRLIVAAAGNESSDTLRVLPAAWEGVLAVGANDLENNSWVRAKYSNFPDYVAVRAPGSHVVPFVQHAPCYGKARVTGTSFAVPVVAGVIADCWCGTTERLLDDEAVELLHGLKLDGIEFGPGA